MNNLDIGYAVHLVFFVQIVLVSLYVSSQWRSSRAKFLNTYQQNKFPNLYTQTHKTELSRLNTRKHLDFIIAAFGIALLVAITFLKLGPNTVAQIMVYFAAIQFIPFLISAIWCQKSLRIMRDRYPQKKREAEVAVPNLFNYVKPIKLIILGCVYGFSLVFSFYIVTSEAWGDESYKTVLLSVLSTIVLFWIMFKVYKALLGKRDNHFIEQEERELNRYDLLNHVISTNLLFCSFIVVIQASNTFDFETFVTGIFASILFQVIIFLTRHQYFPLNPSVYK